MRLNHRVKRIESEISINDSEFCRCFDEFLNQMIDGIYDRKSYETDFSTLPKDFCEKCRKPVDSERIENLNRQIEIIFSGNDIGLVG